MPMENASHHLASLGMQQKYLYRCKLQQQLSNAARMAAVLIHLYTSSTGAVGIEACIGMALMKLETQYTIYILYPRGIIFSIIEAETTCVLQGCTFVFSKNNHLSRISE